MKYSWLLTAFFAFSFSSLHAGFPDDHSVLPPGRLILALETTGLRKETTAGERAGGATRHLINAMQQQAGIIIASTSLWKNAIKWTRLLGKAKADVAIYHAPDARLTVLVPPAYLTRRLEVTPRQLRSRLTHDDAAVGIWLSRAAEAQTIADLFVTKQQAHPYTQTRWHVYMNGHGFHPTQEAQETTQSDFEKVLPGLRQPRNKQPAVQIKALSEHFIGGITLDAFVDLLLFFDRNLLIESFYYQSCYAGGAHTQLAHYYNRKGRTTGLQTLSLSYPLIAGALTDTVVRSYPFHTDLLTYFERMEAETPQLGRALAAITPLVAHHSDIHGITGTPLIRAPHTHSFEPVAVDYGSTNAPSIAYFTDADEIKGITHQQPFSVKNKRALLLSVKRITTPLVIHPYGTKHLMPALVSMQPGNAIHHITQMHVKRGGLLPFLQYGFLYAAAQKSRKVFLIDKLTLHNDLRTSFHDTTNTWWNFFFGSSPRTEKTITLEKVIITSHLDTTMVFFLEPMKKGTQARSITLTISLNPEGKRELFSANNKIELKSIDQTLHAAHYKRYQRELAEGFKL